MKMEKRNVVTEMLELTSQMKINKVQSFLIDFYKSGGVLNCWPLERLRLLLHMFQLSEPEYATIVLYY